jgi:cytochrome c-type biogenesis protein CcmH
MKRLAVLTMLLCALAGPGLAIAADPPVRANLPEIEDEVMCPVCGTLLGLSHSPAAERERVFIRKLIAEGKTDDEIKDALVAEYGGQVLALPENRGIDVWAYAVPVIGLILGALGVIWAIIAWRRRRPGPDDDPPEDGPTGEEAERLDRDMARFDL